MIKAIKFKRILMLVFVVAAIFVFTGCGPPNIEKLKANQDIKGIIQALEYDGSESMSVKGGAIDALIEIGPQAVELLIEALNHRNPKVSAIATELLGEIGDARAVEPLIAALNKEDKHHFAAVALAKIGDLRATQPLLQKMETDNVVWETAAWALTMINVKYMLPLFNGESVTAAAYSPNGPGPHPVIIADENYKDNWNDAIPLEWRSLGFPEKIELVLYYEIEEIMLEECTYRSGEDRVTITRIRQDWNVTLCEAATGNTVVVDILEGDTPRDCTTAIGSESSDGSIIGGVSDETLIEWLR